MSISHDKTHAAAAPLHKKYCVCVGWAGAWVWWHALLQKLWVLPVIILPMQCHLPAYTAPAALPPRPPWPLHFLPPRSLIYHFSKLLPHLQFTHLPPYYLLTPLPRSVPYFMSDLAIYSIYMKCFWFLETYVICGQNADKMCTSKKSPSE